MWGNRQRWVGYGKFWIFAGFNGNCERVVSERHGMEEEEEGGGGNGGCGKGGAEFTVQCRLGLVPEEWDPNNIVKVNYY